MTREEFEALLEEAFIEGYNDAIDEIFEEDNTFDLEDEMDSYLESNKETKARNKKTLQNYIKYQKYYPDLIHIHGNEVDEKGRIVDDLWSKDPTVKLNNYGKAKVINKK